MAPILISVCCCQQPGFGPFQQVCDDLSLSLQFAWPGNMAGSIVTLWVCHLCVSSAERYMRTLFLANFGNFLFVASFQHLECYDPCPEISCQFFKDFIVCFRFWCLSFPEPFHSLFLQTFHLPVMSQLMSDTT